jgi:hypothetical protein
MEAEIRAILDDALYPAPPAGGLGTRIHLRFAAIEGVDIEVPTRSDMPRAAGFDA